MQRTKLTPAAHLLLVRDNRILLSRRFNTGYEDGNYSVPAGHIDGEEKASEAMIREVKEEICITLQSEDLKVAHIMHRKAEEGRIDFFFTANNYEGEIKIGEPNKCDDLSWFPIDELPENMVPYVRYGIEQYLKNKFYSEFGW